VVATLFRESSADDLLHACLDTLIAKGEATHPSRGSALELRAVTLELDDPLARLSRSAARGRIFSPLGETLWYLSKTNSESFISYYVEYYKGRGEAGRVWAGYGEQLFSFDGFDQVAYVIERLRSNPESRQAAIQIYDHDDVAQPHNDVPCTCTLQYFVRGGALHAVTYMRSNDAFVGLPHDLFAFTFLQELIARSIGIPLGIYSHMVGSMHLYEDDQPAAHRFLEEGWQSSSKMPGMPLGDPWDSIDALMRVEALARDANLEPNEISLSDDPYWADLQRLLVSFALMKRGRPQAAKAVSDALTHDVYRLYIDDRLDRSKAR
jgi:thymidylate synthase